MPSQPLLSFLATVLSQLFLKRPLSKVATVRHQLSLRFPLTQDLANAPVMASHNLTLPNNHLSLKREAAATIHSEASVAAMVAPATVVPRAASVQEVASVLPRLATAAKATANPREDSANPEVDTVASVLPRAATASPEVVTVPSELPRAATAAKASDNPEADTAPEVATANLRAVPGAKTSSNPNQRVVTASPEVATANPEADMAAPEADTEANRKASVDSKNRALEVKAAMALPEAVQVMVVDLVESAPTEVDMAVPDMEAQEDGEELSFCVYGLNA